jgi:starch phosphorylase
MQTQGLGFRVESRTSLRSDDLQQALTDHLFYLRGTFPQNATLYDYYIALVNLVRDRLLQRWATTAYEVAPSTKRVAYFSSKFLAAPQLATSLLNLGITEPMQQVADSLGFDLSLLLQQDGLTPGNQRFGQLATCHLDSLATLGVASIAYGIRYEFDLCREQCSGQAVETIDQWLRYDGNPWEISHPERAATVQFGGSTETYLDEQGRFRVRWLPQTVVRCVPYDVPISGYQSQTVNTLRLWSANRIDDTAGGACTREDITTSLPLLEQLITVLTPEQDAIDNPCIYLQQQFFLISCSLQDAIRIHCQQSAETIYTLPERFAFQLNEVHHAIAIPELMRLFIDEHGLDWDTAWQITQKIFTYTHQALLAEGLERFSIPLFEALFPRHLEIIYEINQRFLVDVRHRYPEDETRIQRMSLIDELEERYIRFTHLAYLGSHVISSVSGLHTKLLKQENLRDFFSFFPERFKSRSHRVIPDRFMAIHNPALANLITGKIGDRWLKDLNELKVLEVLAEGRFCEEWQSLKRSLKQSFAKQIFERQGIQITPNSLFDVHTRPIRERHRQHLSLLYLITLYNRIKANPTYDFQPRTVIFNESMPSKCPLTQLIVKLARSVAQVVNADSDVSDRLKIIFLEQINGLSPSVYAAADLIEQLTIASEDSSGIESMKFALSGALTIGTLSPVNIEIRNQVGEANFFLFGLALEEVNALKASGYNPWNFYHNHRELQGAIDRIASGHFADGDPNVFKPFIDETFGRGDEYLLLADYPFYVDCQDRAGEAYRDTDWWTQMAILNAARIGYFSSDRVMRDYCQDIWNIPV